MPGSGGGLDAYTEDRIRDWQEQDLAISLAYAEWRAMGWTTGYPLFARWWRLVANARKAESCPT